MAEERWYRYAVEMDDGERVVGWAKIFGPAYSGTPGVLLGESRAACRKSEARIEKLEYLEPVN